MATFTFTFENGTVSMNGQALPVASVIALVSRGGKHVFGSEASSRVISKIRSTVRAEWLAANPGKKASDAPEMGKEEVKAYKAAQVDQVSAWAKEVEAEFLDEILNGNLGVREGGSPVDPLEKEITDQAKAWVRQMLSGKGVKPGQYARGKPIDLNGTVLTFDEIVARRIARDRDNLEKSARKVLADQARKAEKAKEAARNATSLEDLGL